MLEIKDVRDLSCLGHTEEEILNTICVCASRYAAGVTRPKEELKTEEQQQKAIEMASAIFAYLHFSKEKLRKETI